LGKCLAEEFEIKKLGNLKYLLGIEVTQSKHGIFITQHKYVLDFLRDTRKMACKPSSIPIDLNHKLVEVEGDRDTNKEAC